MKTISFKWLLRLPKPWAHLQHVPLRHLIVFLSGVFLLFSVIGFYGDLMQGGTEPYAVVLAVAITSGLNSVLWVLVVTRLPAIFIPLMIAKEVFLPTTHYLVERVQLILHPVPVPAESGLHFAATAILLVVIASYVCFSAYIGIGGREAFRLKNELALAHSIQKTLVPSISMSTRCFEIYGISHPSEKVGGDLVDVVQLPDGDVVAYLADIAGHGLQAGILMGMLKTAARMALTSGSGENAGSVLSMLMDRLNVVLPQVKEAHMYATFTALRLNSDGQAFYGMAASPPLLHWIASQNSLACIEEQQYPLGLLPVSEFPSNRLTMNLGDIAVVATDGILEVNSAARSAHGAEFGIDALGALVAGNANLPLPELAALILRTVRSFGKQADDQTLLLVRRSA
jgi:serine phosphatase RsbU (regulator of sigma subunit)